MKFRIRELARTQHLTMEELAIKSGIKNRTRDPSYSTLRALAAALGVSVEELEDRTVSASLVAA